MGDKPSRKNSPPRNAGAVLARERDISRAEAINALLTRPVDILPAKVGDPIRPFALGLWSEIRCLLRPEVSASTLRKATGSYVHSRRYQIAMARPDSLRHDINGAPVGAVSDGDRLAAQQKYEGLRSGNGARKTASGAAPASLRPTVSKSDMIRAALLNRNGTQR
ncbi:ProQ/FINO family protein [Ensifer sp. ENS06]|uniref:ProQ/FINO family protein n=1 Tax=Ensifer sp. ENS06 TaxID=2769276 RepID=UPI000DE075E1|nr:ProQ/FINO family protein [Ensifer sp. ENS06]MBD9625017.1 ProQ/FINO family protein [Ensifer sp. ENS06]